MLKLPISINKAVINTTIMIVAICILFYISVPAQANILVINNVTVIDIANSSLKPKTKIVIQNGKIIAIEKMGRNDDAIVLDRNSKIAKASSLIESTQLDAKGAYAIPGLIDAHVHIDASPGNMLLDPNIPKNKEQWLDSWGKKFPIYLRSYLASGVTTVLDMAEPFYVIETIQQYLNEGNPGPNYFAIGPMTSLKGGYGDGTSMAAYLVDKREDINVLFNKIKSHAGVGIKLPIEKGFVPWGLAKLERHSTDRLQYIESLSLKNNLPIYSHVTSIEDMKVALGLNVHAFVHTLTGRINKTLPQELIDQMLEKSIYQVSTLSLMDADLSAFRLEDLSHPLTKIVVPAEELALAKDKDFIKKAREYATGYGLPMLSSTTRSVAAKFYHHYQSKSLETAMRAIKDLHQAGVPIVMGSDTVQPYSIYYFHGITSLREIELLVEAGLTPKDALEAATLNAAKMLGLEKRLGSIKVGMDADLVLLEKNPLEEIKAIREIAWTIKNGIARTPQQWMEWQR